MKNKYFGLFLALAVLILSVVLPPILGLTVVGQRTLGVLCTGLILWILEVLPFGVTGLLVIILQPILNIADTGTAFTNFANPTVFFVMATFGLSLAMMKTDLAFRLIRSLLRFSGNDSKKIILAFMIASVLLSSIMSSVPVVAMFAGLAVGMLDRMEKEERVKFGKAIMLAIPFGAMIGAAMTPAGTSINVLTVDLLERFGGVRVGFLNWMVYGVSAAILMLPITWFVLVKVFKPGYIDQSIVDTFLNNDEIPNKLSYKEVMALCITALMIVLWILSTWVTFLNTTIVAVAGLILFFLPGIEIFSWKQFSEGVGWDTVIMIGGVLSIGTAAIEAGLGQWLLNFFLDFFLQLNLVPLLFTLGIIIALLHFPIPLGPAIVAILAGPICALAFQLNISPELLLIPVAVFANCCMLVPLDPVPAITYSYGYYSIKNMMYAGSITTLAWTILQSFWTPIAGKILNIY